MYARMAVVSRCQDAFQVDWRRKRKPEQIIGEHVRISEVPLRLAMILVRLGLRQSVEDQRSKDEHDAQRALLRLAIFSLLCIFFEKLMGVEDH